LYTQYYAGFLFAAQAAWLGPRVRGAQRRRLAACAGAVLAGFAPWLPGLWRQTHKHVYALLRPADLSEALNTLYHLFGVKVSAATWATYGWRAAAPALLALQLAVWAWALARARGKDAEPPRTLLWLAVFTLAIPFALSLRSPIYMGGRYAIVALPFICLAWGWIVERAPTPAARALLLGTCLACQLPTVLAYFATPRAFDREIGAYLAERAGPGSLLVIHPNFWKTGIAYYYPPAEQAAADVPRQAPEELPATLEVVEMGDELLEPGSRALLRTAYRPAASRQFGNFAFAATFRRREAGARP